MIWYVGLSGTLHGLFSFALCQHWQLKQKWIYLLTGAFTLKLLNEQMGGLSLQTENLIGVQVLVDAHLYGALFGIVYFLLIKLCAVNIKN